jgi:hypothetical protein
LNRLKQATIDAQDQAKAAKAAAEAAKSAGEKSDKKAVVSGRERMKVVLSGQVSRAVNVVDDGVDTKAYFVDSDASNSRVRLVGTVQATEDVTVGTRIEVAIAPNESSEVSQIREESGDFFDQRWAEVSIGSRRLGKLSIGKGDTASNNTAEVDLSQTGVIQSSSVADIAGGILFRQKNDATLTAVRVSNAFKNFDGLSRKNRIRYDTPVFHGFRLAVSAVSDRRTDASLWWEGKGSGFTAAGAFGFADPNEIDTHCQFDGSFSMLHASTGLNVTLAAGLKDRKNRSDQSHFYVKGGWLKRFFSVGQTAFGIDYAKSGNLPTGNDDGWSVGAAIVQQFETIGTELYLQYRHYTLDRDIQPDVRDINAGTIGARVKF